MNKSESKIFKKIDDVYVEITKSQLIIELQEENKKLKKLLDKYEEEHSTKFNKWVFDKRENETLKNTNKFITEECNKVGNENIELANRIENAKEYIKDYGCYDENTKLFNDDIAYCDLACLIDILNGDK